MTDRVVGPQIDPLAFDAAPDSFDEYVVTPASTAVHRQPVALAQQGLGERANGELAGLIDAPDDGQLFVRGCFFRYLDSVRCFQRDGDHMCEFRAACTVHYRRQIGEAMPHRNIRCDECLCRAGPFDLEAAQQIRTDIVLCVAASRVRVELERLRADALDQRAHAAAIGVMDLATRQVRQHPRSDERQPPAHFVDSPRQQLNGPAHLPRSAIRAWVRDADQPHPSLNSRRMRTVDDRVASSHPAVRSARSRRSLFNVKLPIFACSAFGSAGGASLAPNASSARSCDRRFHSMAWFGCLSSCRTGLAGICSPLPAAGTDFALNIEKCICRVLLVILSASFVSTITVGSCVSVNPLVRLPKFVRPLLSRYRFIGICNVRDYI